MYIGSLLIGTGFTLAGHQFALLLIFWLIYFVFHIPRKRRIECERLLRLFGAPYADYMANVRSLIPRLTPYQGAEQSKFSWRQCVDNHEPGIILILLILGGVVSFYLFSDKTSTTTTITAERRLAPPSAPVASSPPVEIIVEQPKEKPRTREEKPKPKPPEKKPSTPGATPSPPVTKPTPREEKPTMPSESQKPVSQAEAEVKPSAPVPVERPKAIEEERRKAQPIERPEPVPKTEKEASLKAPEQRPSSLLGDLISQGPQLLSENRHLRVLEQVQKLTPEERQNINVKALECFAHLKRYVVDKDKQSKPLWSQLYEFLEKSNNRNATPLLVKITKDPEEYTRLYAVTLLGSIGDHRAIGDLQQIANSDPNRKIRRSAAKSVALLQKRG
jgi:hypothetical protein